MKQPLNYRSDIDGLRAIAVLSVLLFHLGYLKNGFLGVDIFFAISGYLITSIIFNEINEGSFSLKNFYLRRVRRIIPLVLFFSIVSFLMGVCFMLPNDLENLCHSIISTNIFSNNILESFTAKNYWARSNEVDPVMHTWSLGVEEQFYMTYPLIFLIFRRKPQLLKSTVIFLTFISISLFLLQENENSRFYFLQYRFYELSAGGIAAMYAVSKGVDFRLKLFGLFSLFILLFISFDLGTVWLIPATIFSTVLVLLPGKNRSLSIYDYITSNPLVVYIGKISFSIYIWHQLVFSFYRYAISEHITLVVAIALLTATVTFSIITFRYVESPFRNKTRVPTKRLLFISAATLGLILTSSIYILFLGGILRDIPEFDMYKLESVGNSLFDSNKRITEKHINYNKRVYDLTNTFSNNGNTKVLVYGNSFSRDWANVLMESKYFNSIDLAYNEKVSNDSIFREILQKADLVFTTNDDFMDLHSNSRSIINEKVYIIGVKNFGYNNGQVYQKRNKSDYFKTLVAIPSSVNKLNNELQSKWDRQYINLMRILTPRSDSVQVFTPDQHFISQDGIHLTRHGAKMFAELVDWDLFFNK